MNVYSHMLHGVTALPTQSDHLQNGLCLQDHLPYLYRFSKVDDFPDFVLLKVLGNSDHDLLSSPSIRSIKHTQQLVA